MQGRYTLSDKSADAKSAETFFLQMPNPQSFFSGYQIRRDFFSADTKSAEIFFLQIPLTKSAEIFGLFKDCVGLPD